MVFEAITVVFRENTLFLVVFWANTLVFRANTVVFVANTVVFFATTVVFRANTVVFETNTVVFGLKKQLYLEATISVFFWQIKWYLGQIQW